MSKYGNKKIVFLFGEGLVGGEIYKRLPHVSLDSRGEPMFMYPYEEADSDVLLVSSKLAERGYRIESRPPRDDVRRVFEDLENKFGPPSLVINALGVVGKPNVDWCETHQAETYYGNVSVAEAIFEEAAERDAPMIHISTGCIFNDMTGQKKFRNYDKPNFVRSVYSYTKAEAETKLFERNTDHRTYTEIHRIRMPFMPYSDDRNLFDKLLKYPKVVDTPNSMTSLVDYRDFVAKRVKHILGWNKLEDEPYRGTVLMHAVNEGPASHRDVARILSHYAPNFPKKEYITPAGLDAMTKTPRSNCVLMNEELPPLDESLERDAEEWARSCPLK